MGTVMARLTPLRDMPLEASPEASLRATEVAGRLDSNTYEVEGAAET